MTAAAPTLTLVRGAEYGQEIHGLIFPIRIVTSNAESLDQAIEQSNQSERLIRSWNSHDALVKALRKFVVTHEQSMAEHSDGEEAAYVAARAALTAAGAA